MSKYGFLFISIIIVLITTLVSQEIAAITLTNTIENGLPGSSSLSLEGATSFISTYWGLLTFNVAGVPSIVSLFFIPFNLVIGYIFLEQIIQAIPF